MARIAGPGTAHGSGEAHSLWAKRQDGTDDAVTMEDTGELDVWIGGGTVSVTQGTTPWAVSVVSGGLSNTNLFATVSVPFNLETNILSYTVPATKIFEIQQVELWGDYFAEYFVRVNGTQKGGTNVSSAERSKTLSYPASIVAIAGDIITISVQHQAAGFVKFSTNLMGSLT
jgi:hypothetical protein